MKECEKIQSMIIDWYYGEEEDEWVSEHLKSCGECAEFKRIFEETTFRMNMIADDEFEKSVGFNIDIDDLIDTAEKIKEKKRGKFEVFGFLGTASSVIAAYIALAFSLGTRFVIYSQIAFYAIIPLALLVMMKRKEIRGKENE